MAERVVELKSRQRSTPPVAAGETSLHMTVHKLSNAVDLIETRLGKIEHSLRSLRQRVMRQGEAS
jgi:hypothetical protein